MIGNIGTGLVSRLRASKKAGHREFHSVQCLAPPKKSGKTGHAPLPIYAV